jgi:hypothetical protein
MRSKQLTANKRLSFRILICLSTVFLLTGLASAQTSNLADSAQVDEGQTLRALLKEVRELRLALQRTNLNAVRSQLIFERMRLQTARVDSLARELDNTRAQLFTLRDFRTQGAERVKDYEEQIGQEGDATRRGQLERQKNSMKQNLSSQARREEQLSGRQEQLSLQLQTEQAKLTDLEGQIASFERESSAP